MPIPHSDELTRMTVAERGAAVNRAVLGSALFQARRSLATPEAMHAAAIAAGYVKTASGAILTKDHFDHPALIAEGLEKQLNALISSGLGKSQ